ncbi:hypothetical protein HK405_009585 [Cladochytrium tenue]|nr:hypothetical protein HK405_009585 [Cladochytrium tenue]
MPSASATDRAAAQPPLPAMPHAVHLPVVDISPFVAELRAERNGAAGQSDAAAAAELAAAKAAVARDVDRACREFGFFYLVGHGAAPEAMRGVRDVAREFFTTASQEEKNAMAISSESVRGYQRDWHEAIGKFRKRTPSLPFPHSSFRLTVGLSIPHTAPTTTVTNPADLYAEVDATHPIHAMTTSPLLKGANPYPTQPAALRPTVEAYVETCKEIGTATMRALAMALGLDDERYFDRLTGNGFWCMRLIGYPPLSEGTETDTDVGISCGEHTDYGCLTILNQDDIPGSLQVLSKSGEWINADPIDGAFVVNIGDMVNIWTNHQYRATLHRVIHQKSVFRVSVPFFFEPDFDAEVRPLARFASAPASEGAPGVQPVVYGEHIMRKVSNNFGKY